MTEDRSNKIRRSKKSLLAEPYLELREATIKQTLNQTIIIDMGDYQAPSLPSLSLATIHFHIDALLARGSKGNGNYWPKSE